MDTDAEEDSEENGPVTYTYMSFSQQCCWRSCAMLHYVVGSVILEDLKDYAALILRVKFCLILNFWAA